uniref:ABC-type xenobiotic transporter n=1 Tax=Sedum alfredii TaxID=439688 RepID=A0A856Z8W7_9MAGN|nr:ABCC transporter [Sedum alfredii]
MEGLWDFFCGESAISCNKKSCSYDILALAFPSSCHNHAFIICFDVLLLIMLIHAMIHRSVRPIPIPKRFRSLSWLQLVSATMNGCLGLAYFGYGIWILEERIRKAESLSPSHWWMLVLLHGFTWFLISLNFSFSGRRLPKLSLWIMSVLVVLFAGILSTLSIMASFIDKDSSVKMVLDALTLPGAVLFTVSAFKQNERDDRSKLYTPLHNEVGGETDDESNETNIISPFSKAGMLSKLSFWWMNSIIKQGREKTLQDSDIPPLRDEDSAEACYVEFVEELNNQKRKNPDSNPSVLWAIISCHWKEIIVSGVFACIKVLTISAGPLLLNAFIEVAEGRQRFENEGFVLALLIFMSKSLESLSQRQWYFRTRLIGLKVRNLLTAAIYNKQLRLSSASRMTHSSGEIMNYVTVDAYRIGEFPFWFHQTWTTSLQLCISIAIVFHAVGYATIASLVVIILTVLCNTPLAKLQHRFQTKLMVAQDERLKASSEALTNMKVLKLCGWENHFRNVIQKLRDVEFTWLSAVQMRKGYNGFLFWASPVLVSAVTFFACYFLNIPLRASNVFTFVASMRLVQDPIRSIPDVIGVVIQAKVAFARIVNYLDAPELQIDAIRKQGSIESFQHIISIKSANISWEGNLSKPTLKNITLEVTHGEKVAICGEVGSGKSTLLSAILGEVPNIQGHIEVYGKIAYVSQNAWIQSGSIQENILFGSPMDYQRYQETIERCALVKDLELLPYRDLTQIGERGVNLSGGQKQRIQLARALYQNADVYLLDDPFSAVDAHTASSLFNEYVMGALATKTVLLVTHQVDFLPTFHLVLLMSDGEIVKASPYNELLSSSIEFQKLVNAHKETAGTERLAEVTSSHKTDHKPLKEIKTSYIEKESKMAKGGINDQLIKQEEREIGDTGFKPYIQYLNQNKGFIFFTLASLGHVGFVIGQVLQNSWMAAHVDDPEISKLKLIIVYLIIGFTSTLFLLCKYLFAIYMGLQSSKSLFSQLLNSLFRAPMSFYDSTPLGRILSRVSSDLSVVDLDIPMSMILTVGSTTNCYNILGVLAVITWQVLFISIPLLYIAIRLQNYYYPTAKELMRINGTTKSLVANHITESVAGAVTIRAFRQEDRFFAKNIKLVDTNASSFFLSFTAIEWLIQRLEFISAVVLASSALCMVLLPSGTFGAGFIGMALSYGLSLNISLVMSLQNQCTLANYIISVERMNQYIHIPSEASEIIEENRPPANWPAVGKVEIIDLKIRYRPQTPLVLRGISCTFEGGHKIGIVGRTGSGKTTLISALFRLVEPAGGKIYVDGINISSIGLHDLRSRFGIIPQDPTLFNGTVRYNLDPLGKHSDQEIWEVLGKCQLREVVQEKEGGLNSLVMDDGSNWSMGQRQLFCLGRTLLRKSRILVLDEATASIDNATDFILQKTIRREFADCTVITVAHRIPTVMDCTRVLAISDGKIMEFDEPMKLMKTEGSLFGQLVKEYWSHSESIEIEEA